MGEDTQVLCVGGTEELREVIATAPGIEMTNVASIAGAMERLSAVGYDVVITTQSLPDGSGISFAEAIADAVPVVFCPEVGNESLAGRAIAAGVEGYVPAEEVETHLLERLRSIVTSSRGGREDRNGDPRVTLSALKSTPVSAPGDWLVHDEIGSATGETPVVDSESGVGPNQRCSALIEQSPLAVVEWTTDLAVATWNPAAESLFGYSAAAARGRRPTELVVPEDQREELRNAVKALLTGAETVTTALIEAVTVSGERQSCEWYNTPLFAGDGSIAGVLSFVRDVSTEARPVETLEALYETTRTLFRASSRGAVAERIVDVAREVLGGTTVDIRLHDGDRNALVDTGAAGPDPLPIPPIEPGSTLWRPYDTGEPMTIERVDALDADWAGEIDVESLACYPLDHHGVLVFGLPSREILGPELHRVGNVLATTATAALDRAERERSLRRSQTIVEAIGDGVYAADRNGNLLAVNDTLVSMTGYARTRLERGHLSLILDDEAIERGQHLVQELVDTDVGATTGSAEFDLETASGEMIPCKATLSPLIEDGEFVGIVGILRDVSEHKHMQAELDAHRARIDSLHDAVTRLEECEAPQAVFDTAVSAAKQLLQFDACSIAEYDQADDRLYVRAMSTEAVVLDRDEVRTLESGIDARAFDGGEAQIAADLETRRDETPIDGRFRSALAVPIGDYGVFRAVATPPEVFDDTDARMAELLANHVSYVLAGLESDESNSGHDGAASPGHGTSSHERSVADDEYDGASDQERPAQPGSVHDRFTNLFETISDPIAVLRGDGERGTAVTDVNPAFERVFGHDRETIVDASLAMLFDSTDENLPEADAEEWPAEEACEFAVTRRTETGASEFELVLHPIADASDTPVVAALYIHEQRREGTDVLADTVDVVSIIGDVRDSLAESHPEATIACETPDAAMASADELFHVATYHLVHDGIVRDDTDSPEIEITVTVEDERVRIHVADAGPEIDSEEYERLTEQQERPQLAQTEAFGLWLADRAITRTGGSLSVEEIDPQGTVVTVELPRPTEDVESAERP